VSFANLIGRKNKTLGSRAATPTSVTVHRLKYPPGRSRDIPRCPRSPGPPKSEVATAQNPFSSRPEKDSLSSFYLVRPPSLSMWRRYLSRTGRSRTRGPTRSHYPATPTQTMPITPIRAGPSVGAAIRLALEWSPGARANGALLLVHRATLNTSRFTKRPMELFSCDNSYMAWTSIPQNPHLYTVITTPLRSLDRLHQSRYLLCRAS
jgi:hypothetical protein